MSNSFSDTLFQLICSLEKAEKRHFKLYIKRSSGNEDLKVIELYDALNKLIEYDEAILLKRLKTIKKPQLANIKVHLYKQIMASLRLLKSTDSIDLQLNEQFDYAHILYKKGLFIQSLKILDKAKETAKSNHKVNFLLQAITLEKRIETLHINRSMQSRAEELANEINEANNKIGLLSKLSNMSMLMYSWYILHSHARTPDEVNKVTKYFQQLMPEKAWEQQGFYEKLYLYQSYSWYAFILQDYIKYYKYTQKWVDIFLDQPLMMRVETGHYIKGLHTLLNAHHALRNHKKFDEVLNSFEIFATTDRVKFHDNFRIQAYIYIQNAKLNKHILAGTFELGITTVSSVLQRLKEDALFIDDHRLIIFNYKIALLYFGNGDYNTCIDYLQKIINEHTDVVTDMQSYARLLHLMAHYEMGNLDIIEYLTKSVYRYMSKKIHLTSIEEDMFRFLRKSVYMSKTVMQQELKKLLEKIKISENSRFETRTFAFIDIISWLETKVTYKLFAEIVHSKYIFRFNSL